MIDRKLVNCSRSFIVSFVMVLMCLRRFTESSVIPIWDTQTEKETSRINSVDLTCPFPTKDHRQGMCTDLCHYDNQCPGNQLCCVDGCRKLCMDPLMPPPMVDWEHQPSGYHVAGNNWLVEGPAPQTQGETCSTTTLAPGILSLSCPVGFTCVIEDEGDPARGIPNRGLCVEYEKDPNRIPEVVEEINEAKCILDGKELADGEYFYRRCNMCACNKGYLICEVQDCDHVFSGDGSSGDTDTEEED